VVPVLYRHPSFGVVLCCVVLSSSTKFFFCSNLIYVVEVTVGDVCDLSFIRYCLCEYKIGMLG
jgi:hypothetical protein